jgi:hypothetical protein
MTIFLNRKVANDKSRKYRRIVEQLNIRKASLPVFGPCIHPTNKKNTYLYLILYN